MQLSGNWSYPTTIRFGAGRIAELPKACARVGIMRPLLVTDRGLASLPITLKTLDILDQAGLGRAIFAEVDPNPRDTNLAAGIEAYKAGGHDGVVAFGGGSGLDLGKLIAFMAGQTRPVWDFEDIGDWWQRADADAIAPIVAVPTTAGTGSEVGRASVLSHTETHVKKVIFHPKILPSIVIADPELTVGMPKAITAGTGMDALAHCLEAYSSPFYHPMSQGIALEGMRLVKEFLPAAYRDGADLGGAGPYDERGRHGGCRLSEGLGRDPCGLASGGRSLRHPSRHDERGGDAGGVGLQPARYRGPDRASRWISWHFRRVRRVRRLGHGPAGRAGDPGAAGRSRCPGPTRPI